MPCLSVGTMVHKTQGRNGYGGQAMGAVSKAPDKLAGACINSGNLSTGEVPINRGGAQLIAVSGMLSGNPDGGLVLVSGAAGRLNSISVHGSPGQVNAQSGIPITFFNATGVLTSGGPFLASGHGILAVVGAATGFSGQMALAGTMLPLDMPFLSGLQVRASSGAPGFSISWTPQTN